MIRFGDGFEHGTRTAGLYERLDKACLDLAGITAITPVSAMAAGGDKVACKKLAKKSRVPVVPGKSSDTVQKDLRNEPDRFVLKYWQPATSLRAGIAHVIKAMAGK